MNKIYVIHYESVDTDYDEVKSGILENKFFEDKDSAREAMLSDFNNTKSDNDDGINNIEESHTIDKAFMQVNLNWYENWEVIELTK